MPVAGTLSEYLSDASTTLPRAQKPAKAVEAILHILERPDRNGGVTYSLYFGDLWQQPFYAVGLDNNLSIRLDMQDNLSEELRDFLEQNRGLLKHPRCCVGVWKGMTEDGSVRAFLDIAVLVYNEDVAIQFGAEGDQIAIFDLRNGVEIDTGGTGWPLPDSPSPQERLRHLEAKDRVGSAKGA